MNPDAPDTGLIAELPGEDGPNTPAADARQTSRTFRASSALAGLAAGLALIAYGEGLFHATPIAPAPIMSAPPATIPRCRRRPASRPRRQRDRGGHYPAAWPWRRNARPVRSDRPARHRRRQLFVRFQTLRNRVAATFSASVPSRTGLQGDRRQVGRVRQVSRVRRVGKRATGPNLPNCPTCPTWPNMIPWPPSVHSARCAPGRAMLLE